MVRHYLIRCCHSCGYVPPDLLGVGVGCWVSIWPWTQLDPVHHNYQLDSEDHRQLCLSLCQWEGGEPEDFTAGCRTWCLLSGHAGAHCNEKYSMAEAIWPSNQVQVLVALWVTGCSSESIGHVTKSHMVNRRYEGMSAHKWCCGCRTIWGGIVHATDLALGACKVCVQRWNARQPP